MSTKLTEPKHDSWVDVDGWIFPNYNEKKFQVDPYGPMKSITEKSRPINSFEFQQSIFGQYRYYYHTKLLNNIHKQCMKLCIRNDTLLTSNLTQEDKLCARECILNEDTYTRANTIFVDKFRAIEILDKWQPIDNVRI
jgi:hypothetical protein